MISMHGLVRFGKTPTTPPAVAEQAPTYQTVFLDTFKSIGQPGACRGGSPQIPVFIDTWAQAPQQAITLFGKVVENTVGKLGTSPLAEPLKKFLSYARREFALMTKDEVSTRFAKEFTGLVSRTDEEKQAVKLAGFGEFTGVFREFFSALDKPGVRDKMLAAIDEVRQ